MTHLLLVAYWSFSLLLVSVCLRGTQHSLWVRRGCLLLAPVVAATLILGFFTILVVGIIMASKEQQR